jgi:hypothetical protein
MNDADMKRRPQITVVSPTTNRQLAAFLKTSIRTIQRLRRRGTLQARIDDAIATQGIAVVGGHVVPMTTVARDQHRTRIIQAHKGNVVGYDTSPLTTTTTSSLTKSPTTVVPPDTSPPDNVTPDTPPTTVEPLWIRVIRFVGWILQTSLVLGVVGYLNVWSKINALLEGRLDPSNWAMVVFQCFLLFLLSQIWPAIQQVYVRCRPGWRRFGAITGLVVAGLLFAATNWYFSIDGIGLARDSVTDKNASIISSVAEWTAERDKKKATRDGLGAERNRIPQFKSTTRDMVAAAKRDYDEAAKAQGASNKDCRALFPSVADCYRAGREFEQRKRKWEDAQADLANQERANTLDGKISKLGDEIKDLTDKINHAGPVPEHKDATTSRIAEETGWSEEKISSRTPIILGGVAELSALIGAIVLDLAFAWLVAKLLGRRNHG